LRGNHVSTSERRIVDVLGARPCPRRRSRYRPGQGGQVAAADGASQGDVQAEGTFDGRLRSVVVVGQQGVQRRRGPLGVQPLDGLVARGAAQPVVGVDLGRGEDGAVVFGWLGIRPGKV
jgi:hypothetical protein